VYHGPLEAKDGRATGCEGYLSFLIMFRIPIRHITSHTSHHLLYVTAPRGVWFYSDKRR